MARSARVLIPLLLLLALAGCSKKKTAKAPASLNVVPAGCQVVATVDGKSLITFYKNLINSLSAMLPPEARGDIPTWEAMTKQVREPTGIDLGRIGDVVVAANLDNPRNPDVAIVISGLAAEEIKGEKAGAVYKLEDAFYTSLDKSRVAFASTEAMLTRVKDAAAGKGKRLVDEGTMLATLLAEDADLAQVRAYIVSGKLPGLERAPFKLEGGGFFMDMNKGASILLHSDEAGAGQLKSMVDMGLMKARAMSGQMVQNMPPGKEADKVKEMIGVFLDGLKVERDGAKVKAVYRGNQSPAMIVGAMAAVAIPAFVTYIRKSKSSEVQMTLSMCHRAVQEFATEERAMPDGTLKPGGLPPGMKAPVCPGDKTVETLDGKADLFDPAHFKPGGKAESLDKIGMVFTDASYACYQLSADASGGFACQAWTDLDDDGKAAHWIVKGVMAGEGTDRVFERSEVERDPASDDW